MDTVDPTRRSAMMAQVKGKNTAPELRVRRLAHAMGLRFRLHRKDLPGKPDLVFPRHKLAVFVHGCFWHRHDGCRRATTPSTRPEFWQAKFAANRERDARQIQALESSGWRVLVLWECGLKDEEALRASLSDAIGHRD
jgi:DNA mismatch endonuclease (patch repair protein)